MKASEKLRLRNEAFGRLREIDNKLKPTFEIQEPSNRILSATRVLLTERRKVVEQIKSLNGEPDPMPVDPRLSKVV